MVSPLLKFAYSMDQPYCVLTSYGCGRNTIGYLLINVLIKSKNFMVKASAFSSIFSTFT